VTLPRDRPTPYVVEPATGVPVAWINPHETPHDPGSLDRDACASYSEIVLADTGTHLIAAQSTNIVAFER